MDGAQEAVGKGEEGFAAPGVDDPDGGDAHGEIVFDAFLDFGHAVFAGEDFDAEDGGACEGSVRAARRGR